MGWMAPLRHLGAKVLVGENQSADKEPSMSEITTVGLDLAKECVPGARGRCRGTTVLRKQLRRAQVLAFFSRLPRCLVGMEACATAHCWARELRTLGHDVRLMPAMRPVADQERRCGCGSDLRGGCAADNALRAGQDGRTASRCAAAPRSEATGTPAHDAGECSAQASFLVKSICFSSAPTELPGS